MVVPADNLTSDTVKHRGDWHCRGPRMGTPALAMEQRIHQDKHTIIGRNANRPAAFTSPLAFVWLSIRHVKAKI
jgi:hypothetical protein